MQQEFHNLNNALLWFNSDGSFLNVFIQMIFVMKYPLINTISVPLVTILLKYKLWRESCYKWSGSTNFAKVIFILFQKSYRIVLEILLPSTYFSFYIYLIITIFYTFSTRCWRRGNGALRYSQYLQWTVSLDMKSLIPTNHRRVK